MRGSWSAQDATPSLPGLGTPELGPPTRYQGSKRKLCSWISSCLTALEFESVLDGFSGTGSVAYLFKQMGKGVTCNDLLPSNAELAVALIENDSAKLTEAEVDGLVCRQAGVSYPSFIADTFSGIYYTDEENEWLDFVCQNIRSMSDRYKRALAWYGLFQAALAKRPFNLFHRRNLYLRTADVERSFGNKITWDRPFEELFRRAVWEANGAVFEGERPCRVSCEDVADVEGEFDLVYLDPPYINGRGTGVDYGRFYHFLDGMLDYDGWADRLDCSSRNLRLKSDPSPWANPKSVYQVFEAVIERFRESTVAISYRSDGIPSVAELVAMLQRHKRHVVVHRHARYQYVLSCNRKSMEVLIVGQ